MPSFMSVTLNDYDGQKGVSGFNIPDIDGATYDAVVTNATGLAAAIDGVTLGKIIKFEVSEAFPQSSSNTRASSPLAQRGVKWVVFYEDNTPELAVGVANPGYRKSFISEIPTADLSLRNGNNNVVYTPTMTGVNAGIQTLVDEFEDFAKSPYGGDAVVQRIEASTRSGG